QHTEPLVRGGLLRAHRTHRGRAGRLRPEQGVLRRPGEGVLRDPRPDPGHAPGQRPGHPVPFGDLHAVRGPGDGRQGADRGVRAGADPAWVRPGHHRGQARADVLLRRGRPPAVPREEPVRLPVSLGDRRALPCGGV
ncbi:MAG: Peptide-methionine (S)-S-oxide reductase MsrA, partial [uncultured Nocardioidaceae bacterium]